MLEISKRIKHSLLDSDEMTKMLIGQHPNTYTFTKALGEQLVKDQASELPVSIFRPSIVVASAQEPMPGWVDNLNGATGKQNFLTYQHQFVKTRLRRVWSNRDIGIFSFWLILPQFAKESPPKPLKSVHPSGSHFGGPFSIL